MEVRVSSRNPAGSKAPRAALATGPLWGGLHEGDQVVVDTAPLIYLRVDHPQFASAFVGLFEAGERGQVQIAVSTISLAEVLVGPMRHRQDALAKRYERALGRFELIPVSTEIAATGARLRASLGLQLPDALQAATALEIGAVALVTHNRDFSKLQGLRVLFGKP